MVAHRVIDHEAKNKMGRGNLVSLFAPTLMTVNADAVSQPRPTPSFPLFPWATSLLLYYSRQGFSSPPSLPPSLPPSSRKSFFFSFTGIDAERAVWIHVYGQNDTVL